MPSDVTGSSIYNQRDADFEFRPGPIFTNLLLADEINRAPPKTQAALLEAMQERQVTIEGETRPLEPPFLVLATQNPIEYEGTYPLPEAQLDRFLLRIGVGYPAREEEWTCSSGGSSAPPTRSSSSRSSTARRLLAMQRAVEQVHVAESVGLYMVDIVAATRSEPRRPGRREPARLARAAEALALPRRAARPRLRHPGRREGGRGAGARAPADAAARAVGAAAAAGGHRRRAPRPRADAAGRGRPPAAE